MSTEGDGKACKLQAVMGLRAAAGAGMLIDKGAMRMGEELREQVEKGVRELEQRYAALYAAKSAGAYALRWDFLSAQVDVIAAQPSADTRVDQQALLEAIAQSRTAIDNADRTLKMREETERKGLIERLSSFIEASHDKLPRDTVWRAEMVLNTTNDAMRDALANLARAWREKARLEDYQEHERLEIQQHLNKVARQLAVAASLAKDGSETYQKAFAARRKAVEDILDQARATLSQKKSEEAMRLVAQANREVRALMKEASERTFESWDNEQGEINAAHGTLDVLHKMVEEASAIDMASKEEARALEKRFSRLYDEMDALARSKPGTLKQRLGLTRERIAVLKQDVLTTIQRNQQMSIAETIADAMADLGFRSLEGKRPEVKVNGEYVRIETLRSRNPSAYGRDDKLVSFDVSRQGDVSYDFAGYSGESCIADAERIFAALRKRGLFILDKDAATRLKGSSIKTITPELLSRREFQPELEANKAQAKLAERLRSILEQMNYAHVVENVVGGSIELEGFNDAFGYRVVVTPEGSAQVFKDKQQIDISHDASDIVVSEILRVQDEEGRGGQGYQMYQSYPSYQSQHPRQSPQRRAGRNRDQEKQQLHE